MSVFQHHQGCFNIHAAHKHMFDITKLTVVKSKQMRQRSF